MRALSRVSRRPMCHPATAEPWVQICLQVMCWLSASHGAVSMKPFCPQNKKTSNITSQHVFPNRHETQRCAWIRPASRTAGPKRVWPLTWWMSEGGRCWCGSSCAVWDGDPRCSFEHSQSPDAHKCQCTRAQVAVAPPQVRSNNEAATLWDVFRNIPNK